MTHDTSKAGASVGPNAITRTLEALLTLEGRAAAERVMSDAGLARYIAEPPTAMVDEREVAALMRAVRHAYLGARGDTIGWVAGRLTGDYLLANRIPAAVQRTLKLLPAGIAARILLASITRHSWTFAGSGSAAVRNGNPTVVSITSCPLCRDLRQEDPACSLYAATFERLFQSLVHPETRVRERRCAAAGASACTFEIRWPGRFAAIGARLTPIKARDALAGRNMP